MSRQSSDEIRHGRVYNGFDWEGERLSPHPSHGDKA